MTEPASAPGAPFVIAIDGPSGTGKSTVARMVAQALDAGYLDTGAMYRLVSLVVLRSGVDPDDQHTVAELLSGITFDSPTDPAEQRHRLAGEDVSAEIRSRQVTVAVTPVSANPAVRAFLLDRQRALAYSGRMVVEGRDIGTVIAPDAALKIFLTAAAAERARRRHRQNRDTADSAMDLAEVTADLNRRDSHDSTRRAAPLLPAADAVLIDSSELAVEQTVDAVLQMAAERGIG